MLPQLSQAKPKATHRAYRSNQAIDTAGALVVALCAATFGLSILVSQYSFAYSSYLPFSAGYVVVFLVLGIMVAKYRDNPQGLHGQAWFIGAACLFGVDMGIHAGPLEMTIPPWAHVGLASLAKGAAIVAAGLFVRDCDKHKFRIWLLDSTTLTFGIALALWATYEVFFNFNVTVIVGVGMLVNAAAMAFGTYLIFGMYQSSPYGRLLGMVLIACGVVGFFEPMGTLAWETIPQPGESLIALSLLGAIAGTSPGQMFYHTGSRRFRLLSTFFVMAMPAVIAGLALAKNTWMDGLPVIVVALIMSGIMAKRWSVLLTIDGKLTDLAHAEGAIQISAAFRDGLTGLPNRTALHERLNNDLIGSPLTVLYIDLDRFKVVNDTAGHAAGDEVLRLCAQRISRVLEEDHELYRVSGDEFVAVISEPIDQLDPVVLGNKIIEEINPPFFVHNKEWFLGASIGIAQSSGRDELDSAALLRNADAAMVAAKENGRNVCYVFDQNLVDSISSQHDAEVRLRHALERGWIIPVYQPIISLSTGRIAGFETLARWRDADGSIRSAGTFIELAEKTKLVRDVDLIVLKGACQFIGQFNHGLPEEDQVWITVNVSPIDLASGEVKHNIQHAIEDSGINPRWLVIELIESALQSDAELARKQLMEIHDLGVGLAIDDFGTGYSSLAHLMRFPVDLLKVDKAFIRELTDTVEDPSESMAAAVLTITKALKFPAIAEGVETKEVAEILLRLGYGLAQGFLYSKPLYGLQALGLRGQILDGSQTMTHGV